ncbi:MAG TPA: sigma-70 family RNA polymerase sigma factor [Pseudobacter sp.]|nr:sigma-70 family RNA polymerase sigma factor [Pseudobacter sp.]
MTAVKPYNETELLRDISGGDEPSFRVFFNHHWDKVYSTAFMVLRSVQAAEDIAQEVFLRFWKNRRNIPELQSVDAWLFIVTRNLVYSQISRTKTRQAYASYRQNQWPASAEDPAWQLAEYNALKATIEAGISQLTPQQQTAFRLSREQGLTHEEIAAQMNISAKSVKDYIVRSLAFLRKHLQESNALLLAIYLGYFDS